MSYPEFLTDKRIVERMVAKGAVTKKGLDGQTKALPDLEPKAEYSPQPGHTLADEDESEEG